MSTDRTTVDYTKAFRALERIAERLRGGQVPLDEVETLLTRARTAHQIARGRIAAVVRLVGERKADVEPQRPSGPTG